MRNKSKLRLKNLQWVWETRTQQELPEKGEMKCSGTSLCSSPDTTCKPRVRDCGSASRTGLQELPEAVAGLNKMLCRNALPSECVQDSAEPRLLYGPSPSRRRAVTPMGSTSLGV